MMIYHSAVALGQVSQIVGKNIGSVLVIHGCDSCVYVGKYMYTYTHTDIYTYRETETGRREKCKGCIHQN